MNRRGFLKGLAGVATITAAPALAREGILMPVKQVQVPEFRLGDVDDPIQLDSDSMLVVGMNFEEVVRQYQRGMIVQSLRLHEDRLAAEMLLGATSASNNYDALGYTYKPSKTIEDFYNDLSLHGSVMSQVGLGKSSMFSKEDIAKLKKRYPSN